MTESQEKETIIDQHRVVGHGSLMDFIEKSETIFYGMNDEEKIKRLKAICNISDEDTRRDSLDDFRNMERLSNAVNELKARIKTIRLALKGLNEQLKEKGELMGG